jgi:hypothetical protein
MQSLTDVKEAKPKIESKEELKKCIKELAEYFKNVQI